MSKVKNTLELGKDITEEDLTFTTEQQEKIAKLRSDKENQFSFTSKGENTYRDKLVEGAPCRFTAEGHTFIGHIKKVYKEEHIRYFDIETPSGLMERIQRSDVWYRDNVSYEDNKDFIHKDLYKMTTQKLLNELSKTRLTETSDDDYLGIIYPSWMIKAVLSTREHIKTKSERKAMTKHKLFVKKQKQKIKKAKK
jgi:uncharacterized protein YprB with RNaseH-like and TPR domain